MMILLLVLVAWVMISILNSIHRIGDAMGRAMVEALTAETVITVNADDPDVEIR